MQVCSSALPPCWFLNTHTHKKNIEHHVLIGFLGLMPIARYSDKTLLVLITAEIKE